MRAKPLRQSRSSGLFFISVVGGVALAALSAAGCKSGTGDRCEVPSDCANAGDTCINPGTTGNGICGPENGGVGGAIAVSGTGGSGGIGTGGGGGEGPDAQADAADDAVTGGDAAADGATD